MSHLWQSVPFFMERYVNALVIIIHNSYLWFHSDNTSDLCLSTVQDYCKSTVDLTELDYLLLRLDHITYWLAKPDLADLRGH